MSPKSLPPQIYSRACLTMSADAWRKDWRLIKGLYRSLWKVDDVVSLFVLVRFGKRTRDLAYMEKVQYSSLIVRSSLMARSPLKARSALMARVLKNNSANALSCSNWVLLAVDCWNSWNLGLGDEVSCSQVAFGSCCHSFLLESETRPIEEMGIHLCDNPKAC